MNERQQQPANERCVDMGIQASLRDGELPTSEAEIIKEHVAQCPDCFALQQQSVVNGQEIYTLISELGTDTIPEPAGALASLQMKLAQSSKQEEAPVKVHTLPMNVIALPQKSKQRRAGWLIAAVAAVLVALLLLPNASVLANQFLSLFRPQQFQAVSINPQSMRAEVLPHLQDLGDVQMAPSGKVVPTNPTLAQVKQNITFPLLLPGQLPAGVSSTVHYTLISGGKGTITFNSQKARAYLDKSGQGAVNIPANLNGATFTIDIQPGVVINYGDTCRVANQDKNASAADVPQVQCKGSNTEFYIAEIPSPSVQATGKASLKDLRDFILSLPKLSPQERALLQAVNLDNGTIPVPIPDQLQSQQVAVQGTTGLQVSEASLKIGAVLWQENDIIYLVASTSGGNTTLDVARSLR